MADPTLIPLHIVNRGNFLIVTFLLVIFCLIFVKHVIFPGDQIVYHVLGEYLLVKQKLLRPFLLSSRVDNIVELLLHLTELEVRSSIVYLL